MELLVTDPAWGTGIWLIALVPVALFVVLGLQTLALHLAERRGKRARS